MPPTPSLHDHQTYSIRPLAEPDAVCAAAVQLALTAAKDTADPGTVGEHLGVGSEGDRVVTHYFACEARGYRGWRWAVVVSRAPRARAATVSDVVLLPGPEAVLAPPWVPWSDRIAPGDLGATDALPYRADDPYLEEGYEATGDEDADEVANWELGLGRPRVLAPQGRDAAATRWYRGDRGPLSDEALTAAASCATCGYFLPVAGSLRQVFGVCANEWSPSDGRVVSVDHGCGAHSETDIERLEPVPLPDPILDETGHEVVVIARRPEPEVETDDEAQPVTEAASEAAAVDDVLAGGAEAEPEPVAEAEPEPVAEPEPEPVAEPEPEPVAEPEPEPIPVPDDDPDRA